MLSTFLVVLPIFALILAGWLVRRLGVLGPHATGELNRFVVYLALPALLFDIVAHASFEEIWLPGFIAAFGLGCLIVFALTIAIRWRGPRHLADAALDGLNAAYANTGFVGFPLAVAALGTQALAPTLISAIFTVCILFAIAIILIEIGLQTETSRGRLVLKVVRQLSRNPLLVAPVLGAFVPMLGLTVPAPAETFLKLLGGAASPCALVALGLFLAARGDGNGNGNGAGKAEGGYGASLLLVALKLIAQPVITYFLARAFGLSDPLTHAAVLLAALPTGTGPFMLAEFYRREAAVTSRTILISTILSVATVSGYLALVGATVP